MNESWLGIAEAGKGFRTWALSPVELVRVLLERIRRLDGRCNAFIRVLPQSALAEAKQAEAEILAGRIRGALHGVPYALKDLIDVAGLPTTCNSKIRRDHVASQDAAVVRRMREAGAVLLGKVTLHEFATGGAMWDLPWPSARNPWELERHPGGSSSGSGTAVAAGFVPAAIGTDTGGSVRHPATACGIVGMKPTYGLVSCEGVFPLAPSLDHVGPMTRGVEDNALLLEAMTGKEYVSEIRKGVKGLRIGLVEHFYTEDDSADPEYVRGIEEAVKVLRELGAEVMPAGLAPLRQWRECGRVIQQFEQYRVHKNWLKERPQDYSETAREKFSAGAAVTGEQFEQAKQERERLRGEFDEVMKGHEALLTLSNFEFPALLDDRQAVQKTYMRHCRMPFSVTGTPALSVPAGFSKEGLPLGVQLAGKANDEAMLYRVAYAYCNAKGWTARRPDL